MKEVRNTWLLAEEEEEEEKTKRLKNRKRKGNILSLLVTPFVHVI